MPTPTTPVAVPAMTPPPTLPVRGDRTNFPAQSQAWTLWEKAYKFPETLVLANNVLANATAAYDQAVVAAAQAAVAAAQATAAQGSAAAAANTLAAAQAALGATKWVAGAYASGVCAWSPANGQLYRTRAALANSTVDPIDDPTNWFSLGLMSLPIKQVTNTGGAFYGAANGGLNTINEITYAGACSKQLPQTPANGDVCVIVVANGRADNTLVVNPTNPIPMVIGSNTVTDSLTLGIPAGAVTFKYFASSNVWRYM